MVEAAALCYPLPPLAAYADDYAGREPDAQDGALWTWLQVSLYLWRIGQLPDADRPAAFDVAARALGGESDVAVGVATIFADVARRPLASDSWGATLSKAVREGAEHLERAGAFRLAYSLLTSVRAAVQQLGPVDAGLVIVQQGRIARELGAAQTAHDHYSLAERLGRRTHDDALLTRARLGRGILAATRGNFPTARSMFRRALISSRRSNLSELESDAHSGLLMAAVAAADLDGALRHGWAVYRCAAGRPEQQAEVLANLAGVALLAGHPESALAAALEAVRLSTVDRIQLAGYGTAAVAAARLDRADVLERVAAESMRLIDRTHQQIERAYTLLELAEAYEVLARRDEARQYLARARAVAEPGQFFELLYRADALGQRLASPRSLPATAEGVEVAVQSDHLQAAAELSGASRRVIRSLAAFRS